MRHKIFIIYILITILATVVNAQLWQENLSQGVNLFKANDFKGAITYLDKALPELKNEPGDSILYCDATHLIAVCYVKLGQLNESIPYFKQTISDCNQPAAPKKKNYISANINLAQVYLKLKDYTSAEKIYPEVLSLTKNTYGEKNQTYISLWNSYPQIFLGQNKIDEAEQKYNELILLKTELFGEKSNEVLQSKSNLGNLYLIKNQLDKAESVFYSIVKIRQDTAAPLLSKSYAISLTNLGETYSNTQQLELADSVFAKALNIFKNTGDEKSKSKDYLNLLSKQAKVFNATDQLVASEKNYKILVNAFFNSSNNNIEYINALNNLASLYRKVGRSSEAEPLYFKAVALAKLKLGETNPEYSNIINNQGLLYDDMGQYDKAEKLYKQVLLLTEKNTGLESLEYATTLDNLGLLYKNTGRLVESETAFTQAYQIRKKLLGTNNTIFAASCNNLASLYQAIGRFKEAEPLYKQAAEIITKSQGNRSVSYASTINNLASLYESTDKFDLAIPLYNEALEIYKEKLGERHPDYIATMNNLGLLTEKRGDFKTAEKLFKDNANKALKSLGKNHPTYATILSNLGALYEHKAQYKKADSLYKLVLTIRKSTLGERHPDYTLTLFNLARLYSATHKFVEADTNWSNSLSNYIYEIKAFFPSMSEKEKGEFYDLIKSKFENFNAYAVQRYSSNPKILSNMYNYQLETKALLLNASNKVRSRILNSNDTNLIAKYKQWNGLKDQLANYYSLGKSELLSLKINTDSLEKIANQIEKELSVQSELFNKNTNNKNLKWQDIQKVLGPKEAAVEIIRFPYFKFDSAGIYSDSVIYAILIIKKDTKTNPEIVLLPNGNELENKYLKVYRNSIRFKMEDNNSYAQFWEKIKEKLNGVEKVYVSPDGIYNLININALSNNTTGKYAFEEIDIQSVTNTKDLLEQDKSPIKISNAIIIGDPEFYPKNTAKDIQIDIAKLPGTRTEVNQINNLLTNNHLNCQVFTDIKAAEEVLKTSNNPYVLHIATHGFFEKDEDRKSDSKSKTISNPLLRSGLLMAGSGITLSNRKAKTVETPLLPNTQEDGIFTAYEAMSLNLDKTELVILSACETGLGEVRNGEGVYGLQRALKIAGAKSIIISLWKVNDVTTQKLMNVFYSELLATNDKKKSFRTAQESIKKEFPHPYYWGAFMLIGN